MEFKETQFMVVVLFGTNAILFGVFQVMNWYAKNSPLAIAADGSEREEDQIELIAGSASSSSGSQAVQKTSSAVTKAPPAAKAMAKPFTGTFECYTNLTSELFRTGLICALTYICEKHWMYEHSTKSYSRDLFLFIVLLFFLYAFYTVKPITDLALLGREQTEEWKGWMQFIFLLYHYFHAEEVYNSVRVMITCYVWMTGFGNFSFFYIKQDFGWLRVMQMMWRLNFSVLLLMWTHGNTWILYYICPMHTFYFLMVYATMYVYSSTNHSKWGIRLKLMIVGILIYLIWDINEGLFDIIFAWLGTDKVIGANYGSVWEYYFRTSLDHWSSFLGMIFALNFPVAEQFFLKAGPLWDSSLGVYGYRSGIALWVCAFVMLALTIWWFTKVFPAPKLEYNLTHNYYAIIPLTSYIFFRNASFYLRGFVSMSLHDLGKTTLETYLLQHHIWLTSNAKTLLTIVPGQPFVNFMFATMLFFFVAKELYRLTMCLRGMIIPEDKTLALTNMAGATAVCVLSYAAGTALFYFQATWLEMLACCCLMALLVLLVASRTAWGRAVQQHGHFTALVQKAVQYVGMALVAALLLQVALSSVYGDSSYRTTGNTGSGVEVVLIGNGGPGAPGAPRIISPECAAAVSNGAWGPLEGCNLKSPKAALCKSSQWTWQHGGSRNTKTAAEKKSNPCAPLFISEIAPEAAQRIFDKKNVLFIGDSIVRQSFHQFAKMLDPTYDGTTAFNSYEKHANLQHISPSTATGPHGTTVSFKWAPFVRNATQAVIGSEANLPGKANIGSGINGKAGAAYDVLVVGASLWDTLHVADKLRYEQDLQALSTALQKKRNDGSSLVGTSLGAPVHIPLVAPVPVHIWLQPTTIVDARLQTDKKKERLAESNVRTYAKIARKSLLARTTTVAGAVDAIVDPSTASAGREDSTMDGIHYVDEIYGVVAQMLANVYTLSYPASAGGKASNGPYKAKTTGSMSKPWHGMGVLVLSAIMLCTMDSFLGLGYLSLLFFGKKDSGSGSSGGSSQNSGMLDWDSAYGPLHKKLGVSAAGVRAMDSSAAGEEQESALAAAHSHGRGERERVDMNVALESEKLLSDSKA